MVEVDSQGRIARVEHRLSMRPAVRLTSWASQGSERANTEAEEYAKGVWLGLLASLLPASDKLHAPPEQSREFYVGYAGAHFATGGVELWLGLSMLQAGGGLVAGGAAVSATGVGTLPGGAVAVSGGATMAAGTAITAAGVRDLGQAFYILLMAGNRGGPRIVPNPYGSRGGPAHQAKVKQRIEELKRQGHEHLAGGELSEEIVKVKDGQKSYRRPDITTADSDGNIHRENVGLQNKKGEPLSREKKALDDIERATGSRPGFTPYNNQAPEGE